jgi:glutamate dehydrogenase
LRALTTQVLTSTEDSHEVTTRINAWLSCNRYSIDHCHNVFAEIRSGGKTELAMLSVAMRELRALNHTAAKEE